MNSDHPKVVLPIHTDSVHIAIVAIGAFFGTLARYEIEVWLPSRDGEWPTAIFIINILGAFLLGFLLQSLFRKGKDEGSRRRLRLALGTGFLGAFTTYSSLATGVVLLMRGEHIATAITYALVSVMLGIIACMLGIRLAGKK